MHVFGIDRSKWEEMDIEMGREREKDMEKE